MSIHSEIKRLRLAKGWSQGELAAQVAKAEGRSRPLSWQTVQQWEREPTDSATKKSTAPSRKRLETVAKLLGTTAEALLGGRSAGDAPGEALSAHEGMLVAYYRVLSPQDRDALLTVAKEKATTYHQPITAKLKATG